MAATLAAGGAGDEGDFAFELSRHVNLSFSWVPLRPAIDLPHLLSQPAAYRPGWRALPEPGLRR
jgi:hypothetical protein